MLSLKSTISLCVIIVVVFACLFVYVWVCQKLGLETGHNNPKQIQPTKQDLLNIEQGPYLQYGTVIIDCVSNNFGQIGLVRPGNLPQHMASLGYGVSYDSVRGIVFHYFFDRSINVSSGGVMKQLASGSVQYSTVPVASMIAQLNATLGNYCIYHHLAPCKIERAHDVANNRVHFEIVSA